MCTKCNLCGGNKFQVLYRKVDPIGLEIASYSITRDRRDFSAEIRKCQRCGLVFKFPQGDTASLRARYERMVDEYYVEEARSRQITFQRILNMIDKYRYKRGRLLDIGCSIGLFLDVARRSGWEVYGVELSWWAIRFAQSNLGICNIYQGTLEEVKFPDALFDTVVIIDTLEHVSDPISVLKEVRRILRENGLIYILTPNIDSFVAKVLKEKWWGISESHLFYFSPTTLDRMLEEAGFRILQHNFQGRVFTLKHWLERTGSYYRSIGSFLRLNKWLLKPLTTWRPLSCKMINLNLMDEIGVLAEKLN